MKKFRTHELGDELLAVVRGMGIPIPLPRSGLWSVQAQLNARWPDYENDANVWKARVRAAEVYEAFRAQADYGEHIRCSRLLIPAAYGSALLLKDVAAQAQIAPGRLSTALNGLAPWTQLELDRLAPVVGVPMERVQLAPVAPVETDEGETLAVHRENARLEAEVNALAGALATAQAQVRQLEQAMAATRRDMQRLATINGLLLAQVPIDQVPVICGAMGPAAAREAV
jgi:hypothetical protein